MKAPDKIYVTDIYVTDAMETEKGLFGLWTDKDHRDTPYVEYIRKDALLECLNGIDTQSRYEQFVIDELINHIEHLLN